MPLEILVTTQPLAEGSITLPSGRQIFNLLGPDTKHISVRVSELLEQLFEEVRHSIDFECTVEVGVSGALTLTGKGDLKYLVFNVGAEAEGKMAMEVKVTTKLKPRVKD